MQPHHVHLHVNMPRTVRASKNHVITDPCRPLISKSECAHEHTHTHTHTFSLSLFLSLSLSLSLSGYIQLATTAMSGKQPICFVCSWLEKTEDVKQQSGFGPKTQHRSITSQRGLKRSPCCHEVLLSVLTGPPTFPFRFELFAKSNLLVRCGSTLPSAFSCVCLIFASRSVVSRRYLLTSLLRCSCKKHFGNLSHKSFCLSPKNRHMKPIPHWGWRRDLIRNVEFFDSLQPLGFKESALALIGV